MENSVLNSIEKFQLLKNVNNVTVALSGGADSMSLLYVLISLKDKLGIEIDAAHLNHMIRGEEAERDENFVRSVCEKLGIKLFCERADVPAYAKKNRMSTELAARELRYEFLNRVNTGVVATAHTASDNLETMLFNLARGASLKGLCGIPPKRGIFVRPLLLCTRDDVENYCKQHEIQFVTDSTNLSDEYTRNKIRHNIVPVLKDINQSVETSVARTAQLLRDDDEFISSCADNYLNQYCRTDGKLDVTGFENIYPSVSKRVIRTYVKKVNPLIQLDNLNTNNILCISLSDGKVSIPLNMTAVVKDGLLSIVPDCKAAQNNETYVVEIIKQVNNLLKKDKKVNNLLLNNSLDCDKIVGKLVVRCREPGDSIRLKNRNCTKTLKKLYNELRVPSEKRDILPVISDELGVVWIYGIGVAHRCSVTDSTKNVFIIKAKDAQNNVN